MLIRTISAIVALPLLFFFILMGGNVLLLGALIFSLIGLYEFYNAFDKKGERNIRLIGYCSTLALYGGLYFNARDSFYLFLISIFIVMILIVNTFTKTKSMEELVNILFGFLYVPFLLSHIILLDKIDINGFYIWLPFILAWVNDTFAYLVGKKIGKRKLTSVSPNKTVEGSIGGIVGATVVVSIYCYFLIPELFIYSIFLGIFGAMSGQIGDLIASRIKRIRDIKDFGNIMPGHGGVLDRFDSVILTVPLVYYFIILVSLIS